MHKTLTIPLLITLFIHGVILAVLIVDMPQSDPMVKRALASYIPAKLITIEQEKKAAPPPPQKTAKPKPDAIERAKALAKKQAEKERQRALDAAKAKREQAQRDKQLAEQKKARQEEAERQQALEKQRRKEQAERELAEAIAQENSQQQSLSESELANSYIALISQVIQSKWSRPPTARNNMEAELALQLLPTGEVVSVVVVKSSGNPAFDRSARNAVLEAERFPELSQLPNKVFERYFRRLRLKFRPEDLRL